jgi:hypothetical protein
MLGVYEAECVSQRLKALSLLMSMLPNIVMNDDECLGLSFILDDIAKMDSPEGRD